MTTPSDHASPGSPIVDRRLLRDLVLGRATLDRAAHVRSDTEALAALWEAKQARVLSLVNGRLPIINGELYLRAPHGDDDPTQLFLLGVGEDDAAVFMVRSDQTDTADTDAPEIVRAGLREVGSLLGDRDAGLAVTAVALDAWHRNHTHCPRCGSPTQVSTAGWTRRCPIDESEHYPRTDPAVIMLVRDQDDRALLGHQKIWPDGLFSTLAGFVEPGETAETAVRREVLEESGIRIGDDPDDVVYLGSQPWPFPSSLMLGYHAIARTTEITVDGEEISEAAWFSREELGAACLSGDVRVPPAISIARKLIERWFGEPLPGDWSRA